MNIENPTREYHLTETTVYSCQYHIIFTPKYRRPVLTDGIDTRLKQLILEKQDEYGYHVIEAEIMPDHVHLILDINPTINGGVNGIIAKIKSYTSHILRSEYPILTQKLPCLWTRNKFIATCGSVSLETVKTYIANQKHV